MADIEARRPPDLIARYLEAQGVERLFSLSGGHVLPIWDAVAARGIRIVDVRDERAAVHMAQAHSEVTGALGVAIVTAGPGVTNAITGVATAQVARMPVLIIGGARPSPQEYQLGFQDLAHVDMLAPVTNYARTVRRPEHVLRELDEAVSFAVGEHGAPGAAYVEFPTDVLRAPVPPACLDDSRFARRAPSAGDAPADLVARAADLLSAARRPVAIAGRGARGCGAELARLIEAVPCLYLDTMESRGLIPGDHPAAVASARGRVMREADLVITAGCRLDFQLGFGSPAVFPDARFLRLGTHAEELRGVRRGSVEVPGSVAHGLDALARALAGGSRSVDETWLKEIEAQHAEKRQALELRMAQAEPDAEGRMHPLTLLRAVREVLRPDAVLVLDGGDILSFARIALDCGTVLSPGPLGTLGVGVPYAIAASLAFPGRQIVLVTGDGSLGFNLVELDTAVRHGARFLVVVANNRGWNIETYDQMTSYGGRVTGTRLPDTDYAGIARAFGLHAQRVEHADQLAPALGEALGTLPALLDVSVSAEAVSPDARAGLAAVPDRQPLAAWDAAERALLDPDH